MRSLRKKNQRASERGFTLVETLVAILLLLIVVVGPMTIAARGLQSSFFASEQMTAVFLAQEAVEEMHRRRDTNALEVIGTAASTWDWFNELSTNSTCTDPFGEGCDINLLNGTFRDCSVSNECRLLVNSGSTGLNYGYGSTVDWAPSIYTRTMKVLDEGSGRVSIEVRVTWGTNLLTSGGEVVLQTWLYDQYDLLETL